LHWSLIDNFEWTGALKRLRELIEDPAAWGATSSRPDSIAAWARQIRSRHQNPRATDAGPLSRGRFPSAEEVAGAHFLRAQTQRRPNERSRKKRRDGEWA
jgi:hypothetical protein